MNLSPNFTLEELTRTSHTDLDNRPDEAAIANLKRLASFLEQVRVVLNAPILINSGYRSKEVNEAVGGQPSSQHILGCAADIRVNGMTPDQVTKKIIASNLQYDQVIREMNSWTHISIPNVEGQRPRKQALIIDRGGTRLYA